VKKLLQLSTVIFLLLLRSLSFGQWIPVNVNMNNDFVDVQFKNDSTGFISGSFGALLKTTDHGLSWINSNNTGNAFPFKFHFPCDSVGYALGGNSLFKTTDQGATWFALPDINTWDKNNLFFINDSTGFFLASYGYIYKTTDGGITWNSINTNCGATIVEEDIYFTDNDTGYFGGWYVGCASRTTDGGITWQTLPGNLLDIMSIYFPTPSIGYMSGIGGIQKTMDSGDSWMMQNTPVTYYYSSIYCIGTNTCYSVGSSGVIIKTTDGGANWQQQYSGTTQNLRKIYCIDANTCYAVGDSGTVLKTVNGGITGLGDNLPANSGISIFPNPASDKLIINLNSSEFEIEVYNSFGKRLRKIKNENELDVSNLPGGIYFIKIFNGNKYFSKKFIIE
jgi:photosystem II stability/assembly factor-like uncharacterized protein